MANDFDLELARDFGTALLLGALIGVEREKHNMRRGFGVAGLRSFVLLALVGALGGHLATTMALAWLLPAVVVAATASVIVGYLSGVKKHPESLGITSELAAIVTCLLGATVMSGQRELAVGLGVTVAALLAYKRPLHEAVDRIDRDDVLVGMRFLLATFIVLPLLPDATVDPWDAINPYKLWLLVLLISGLSLVGYIASRVLGAKRGLVLTAITGGLVSSTAVTLAFVKQSRDGAVPHRQLAAGTLLAWAIMSVRVLVTVAILQFALVSRLWLPCLAMTAVAAAGAAFHLRAHAAADSDVAADVKLKNPFSLLSASKFGLLFAAVQLLLALAQEYLPRTGVYTISLLAGITDVDAITLSMAERVREQAAAAPVATVAIMLASFSNTLGKVGIAMVMGRGLTVLLLPVALAMVTAGAAVLWLA